MIDIADGRPRRRYSNGVTITLYPCARCGKNLVVKKGKMCRKCSCRTREENYKAKGIRHPVNTTFADPARIVKFAKGKHRRRNGTCAAHWMIDEKLQGKCSKCDRCDIKSRALLCGDTGLPCPHNGVRDFAALMEKHARRFTFLESCSKGGNISGQRRGGKRGRPKGLTSSGRRGRSPKFE